MDESIVTREVFLKYVKLQRSGLVNMLSSEVRAMTGITMEQHYSIIEHYSKYYEQFMSNTDAE